MKKVQDRNTMFSDKAYFWLNEQNSGFCFKDQPEALQKLPMQPENSKFGVVYELVSLTVILKSFLPKT